MIEPPVQTRRDTHGGVGNRNMCRREIARRQHLARGAFIVCIARRALVSIVFVSFLATTLVYAQQPAVYRTGALSFFSPETDGHLTEVFRQRLTELGWVEGQTVSHDIRYANGLRERLPDLVAELLRLRPSIIFTGGDRPAAALKRAGGAVPVVFVGVTDPVGLGLVASLARPGGTITGVSSMSVELHAKRLELLKQAIPAVTRVGILADPKHPLFESTMRAVNATAQILDVRAIVYDVKGPTGLEGAFTAMSRDRVGAVLGLLGLLSYRRVAQLSAESRIPCVGTTAELAHAGCLISYAANLVDEVRRGAELVDRILRGTRPADLPVEQPVKFDLVVDLKTAKALGLTLPQSVLLRADEVIQ